MTQHPGPLVTPSSPPWERTATPPGRPVTVRTATVLLVVLSALLGVTTSLVLIGTAAGSLTGTADPTGDPARAAGRLVGGAVVVGVPLALTALHAWMVLAVRARRSWPARVLTVLAVLGGIGVVTIISGGVWTAGKAEDGGTSLLVAVVLLVPAVLVLGLQTGAAVLLLRLSARAWALGGAHR